MSKIRIKVNLNTEEKVFEGIKSKNSLIYKDSDILVKIKFSNNVILIRENSNFKIDLVFDKNKITTSKYYLKDYRKFIDLKVQTQNLEYDDNYLHIVYKIIDTNENIDFKLEFEEI